MGKKKKTETFGDMTNKFPFVIHVSINIDLKPQTLGYDSHHFYLLLILQVTDKITTNKTNLMSTILSFVRQGKTNIHINFGFQK